MATVTAAAQFADVQYELMRLYRNRKKIENLAFSYDVFFGTVKRRLKKVSGQADVLPLAFEGAGVPSNTQGTSGLANPTQGQQFLVTPVQMTNLAQITALGAAGGAMGAGALVQTLRQEIDGAMIKVGKHASIQAWSDGFPAFGQVSAPGASTTLQLVDPDDIAKFAIGDVLMFAASRTTGATRAGTLTVKSINSPPSLGQLVVDQNVTTGIAAAANNDFIFIVNQRDTTGATKIAITGVQGWLPATPGTLFGVNQALDYRLAGIQVATTAADIEGAFIDGIAAAMQFSKSGAEGLTAYMHPKTWATLAKAMQSKTIVISPYGKPSREGEITFSGWKVSTPNGIIEVFAPQFCPKNTIFMLNMSTWELVSWSTDFPSIVATQLGAAPGIFMDPLTGNISCMVGGFPQLECKAPGKNLVLTLS